MPRQGQEGRQRSISKTHSPATYKRTPVSKKLKNIKSSSPFPSKQKKNLLKTITEILKNSESRLTLAQKTLFTGLVKEEILSKSKSVYDKVIKVIQACFDREVFSPEEFEAYSVSEISMVLGLANGFIKRYEHSMEKAE